MVPLGSPGRTGFMLTSPDLVRCRRHSVCNASSGIGVIGSVIGSVLPSMPAECGDQTTVRGLVWQFHQPQGDLEFDKDSGFPRFSTYLNASHLSSMIPVHLPMEFQSQFFQDSTNSIQFSQEIYHIGIPRPRGPMAVLGASPSFASPMWSRWIGPSRWGSHIRLCT